MNEHSTFRPSNESKGYLDTLKENGTFARAIDAYAFAAAFAMKADSEIDSITIKGRSDLAEVRLLDDEVRLALECGVNALRKRRGLEQLADQALLVDAVTRYAEVGLRTLKQRWEGKTWIQIHHDIKKLVSE